MNIIIIVYLNKNVGMSWLEVASGGERKCKRWQEEVLKLNIGLR